MHASIYTKSNCKFCSMLKKFLDQAGVTYDETNLDSPEMLALFKEQKPSVKKVPHVVVEGRDINSNDYHAMLIQLLELKKQETQNV